MVVYVGLKEKRGKKQVKNTTFKIFVCEKDLPSGCARQCVMHAIKALRNQLNEFYADLHFDVTYGDRPDDLTAAYETVDSDAVMDTLESIEDYIDCVLDDPEVWCQCVPKNHY